MLSDQFGFVTYSTLLVAYLTAEVRNLRLIDSRGVWLNPVVLASLITFIFISGLTNILYFMPENLVLLEGIRPDVTPWMNKFMFLVVLGACAMWTGYDSAPGKALGDVLQRSNHMHALMRTEAELNRLVVIICIVISIGSRLLAIKLGVFGYSASYENLITYANIREYLNMADMLSKFALLVVAIHYFATPNPSIPDRGLMWFIIGYQVLFGFLSGFKSAVVVPFIIVALACYSQQHRFPRWLIPAIVVALTAAFLIIEPFRVTRHEKSAFVGTSLESIISTITDVQSIQSFENTRTAPVWLSVIARNNFTYTASLGIEYAANKELPDDSPPFLSNILLSPAHALIPRFLWHSKPLQEDGYWYTRKVVGQDIFSASAMTPFTYLNFAGGPVAVVLGFFLVGVIQRGMFEGLSNFGTGGLVVLMGLLTTIGTIDSSFNTVFVGTIRYFPMLVLAQCALLRHACQPDNAAMPHGPEIDAAPSS